MKTPDTVNLLINDLSTALERAEVQSPAIKGFTEKIVVEMRSADLVRNPSVPKGLSPTLELQSIFEKINEDHNCSMLHAICKLWPQLSWIRADQFYPEPKFRYFSEKVWGALIVGEDDALFTGDGRYIALLIVVAPNTTYPLHAHRIVELYYMLSGQSDWSRDGTEWTTLSPGSLFFNHAYEPHAIRSNDDPLIAVGLYLPPFGWEGGLLSK